MHNVSFTHGRTLKRISIDFHFIQKAVVSYFVEKKIFQFRVLKESDLNHTLAPDFDPNIIDKRGGLRQKPMCFSIYLLQN